MMHDLFSKNARVGTLLLALGGVALSLSTGCLDETAFPQFDQAKVLSFSVENQARATQIDSEEQSIEILLSEGDDPTQAVIAELEVSSLATTQEKVGDIIDLSSPYELVVTAEDGTKGTWKLVAELPSSPPGVGGSGGTPEDCESWLVTYALDGQFETADTPAGGAGDAINDIGPGELVLRVPIALADGSPVTLISYSMPQVFTIDSPGTTVTTETMASAGPDECGIASGSYTEAGKIVWGECDYGPAPPYGTTEWGPSDVVGGVGCIRDYNSSGTVSCTGTFCGLAGLDEPKQIDDTYPQPLNSFEYSSPTQFTMLGDGNPQEAGSQESVEVPTEEPSRTWLSFVGTETSRQCAPLPTCE